MAPSGVYLRTFPSSFCLRKALSFAIHRSIFSSALTYN